MFEIFKNCPNLIAIISEKKDGTMKIIKDLEGNREMIENRKKFFKKFGIDEKQTVIADLVHGNKVKIVSAQESGKIIGATDGLISADRNLFLTITVADCLPLFIYDPEKEIISLIHGGWRNLAKNILEKTIKKMAKNFESSPKDILISMGPGISRCHYEVKEDLLKEFRPYLSDALLKRKGKNFLDLKKIAEIQLINLGLREENIEINPECTFCLQDKYFSFRRDKPKIPETMLAVIGRINI